MFINLAIESQADILVTGDRALLAMDIGITTERAANYKPRWGHKFES